MKKIALEVLALSHSITHSHSYAVVLGEVDGGRRIPIVIGGFEAQAIAIALESMTPSRPLTHDLIKNICGTFEVELIEVVINNLADGIFYSQLICKKGTEEVKIDSRTSDALALALRFGCPIYTFESIIESAGIITKEMDENEGYEEGEEGQGEGEEGYYEEEFNEEDEFELETVKKEPISLGDASIDELHDELNKALKNENYEEAAKIRDEIDKREK